MNASSKQPDRRARTALWATVLALFTVVLLTATAPDIGLTWDEPAYIAASESHVSWLGTLVTHPGEALSPHGIRRDWELNHEHPPLDKVWSGLVWGASRAVLDDLTAHRLGNMTLVGGLVALLYAMIADDHGHLAGLAAVGALLTMPRFYAHAHLAALDVPAAVSSFAVVYTFWRTRDRPGGRWSVLLGVVWGLALATKINAILVPPVLFLWTLLFQRRRYLFARLAVMGLVGIPLSLTLWPWLYHESMPRLIEYVRFVTVDHWEIGQWYLGRFHMPPPWHFPFVMTLAVVPLTTTILYFLGTARTFGRQRERALGGLLVLCALTPMAALAAGQGMVYDNERLFMPAFPYLAALAGLGFAWVLHGLEKALPWTARSSWKVTIPTILAGIVFVPQVATAFSLYPHLLSYYSATVGGLPGAVRLGLETTYWCETYAQTLPYLNAHAQPGDIVWVEDWSHDVMLYYQLQGALDRDLRIACVSPCVTVFERQGARPWEASIDEADYAVIQYRQTGLDESRRSWLRLREPIYQVSRQGIPLVEIYAR